MSNRQIRKMQEAARTYRFARSQGFGVSADVAGNELHRIATEHGHLSSELVVEEARPESAALHPAFEWDDSVAGERYRVHQASTLVRAVVVVPPEKSEAPEHRAYVLTTVEQEPRPVYVDAAKVVNSPSMFADAISRLERKLNELQRSVEELQSLAAQSGAEPERMARIGLAMKALEAAGAAVAGLH